ncbi:MAG: hypothetical protein J0G28_05540 [Afipia sp.]|nr:hypothetical protein [Afipia sp.]OJW60256.1 MAG: hypothetical protein BGO65_11080 [Afipia sp. 64-13]
MVAAATDLRAGEAKASSLDSEHLFGFTVGSDIGGAGEVEIEAESDSGLGKRSGRYFAALNSLQLKYTWLENVRIAPHVEFGLHAISGVPGMDDLHRVSVASGGVEFKYRLLDRASAPFGLTFGLDVAMGRIDAATGLRTRDHALDVSVALDRELVADRLFGALNVVYAPGWARDHDARRWSQSAVAEVGGALVARIADGVYAGGEVRYLRAYDSVALSDFAGEAVFAGPSLYVMLSPRANMTIAWNTQVAGHVPGERGPLDLAHFERHQLRVRLGMGF